MNTKVKIILLFCALVCLLFVGCKDTDTDHVCAFDKFVTKPTCVDRGYTTYSCACGEFYISDYTEKVEHSYRVVTTLATCVDGGFDVFTCICGDSYTENHVEPLGHLFLNYISNNDATYLSDGTKTACCERKNCSAIDTVNDEGTKKKSQIQLNGFELENQTYRIKLSSDKKNILFSDYFSVIGVATYSVYKDEKLTEKVSGDFIGLNFGSNLFYMVESVGEENKTHEIDFYRKHLFSVKFISYQNVEFDCCTIEEGDLVQIPSKVPNRDGYKFNGWNFDFSQTILEDKSICAVWSLVEYNVTFDVGEYAKDFNGIVTYNIESGTDEFVEPVKSGYDFDCWLIDGQQVSKIEKGDFGDKIVTAQWKAIFKVKNGKITGLTDYGKTCEVLQIPATVDGICITGIEQMAFYANKKVSTVLFEENSNLLSISSRAFYNCTKLTNLTISKDVTEIGDNAFYGCENLVAVNFEELWALKKIGDYSFYNCKKLEKITLPSKLEHIGNNAFRGCGNLKEIVMPQSVSYIGSGAFRGCTSLCLIKYLGTVQQWEEIGYSDWTLVPVKQVECSDGKYEI